MLRGLHEKVEISYDGPCANLLNPVSLSQVVADLPIHFVILDLGLYAWHELQH